MNRSYLKIKSRVSIRKGHGWWNIALLRNNEVILELLLELERKVTQGEIFPKNLLKIFGSSAYSA
jgi:hypothetical protein